MCWVRCLLSCWWSTALRRLPPAYFITSAFCCGSVQFLWRRQSGRIVRTSVLNRTFSSACSRTSQRRAPLSSCGQNCNIFHLNFHCPTRKIDSLRHSLQARNKTRVNQSKISIQFVSLYLWYFFCFVKIILFSCTPRAQTFCGEVKKK